MENEHKYFRAFLVSISLIVGLFITGVYLGAAIRTRDLINEEILARARAHFNNIVLTRKWNSDYGGVYVEKTPAVVSNPYLKDPDIETVDGRVFTNRNPAIMTREISEYARREGDMEFHITSLKLKNPSNAPDEFETRALGRFERGAKEHYANETVNGRRVFRYMAPLYIEKSCLECHADQGYRLGDSRGGISVTFDVQNVSDKLRLNMISIFVLSLVSLVLILALVFFSTRRLVLKLREARKRMVELATTDALTGLFNRRHLMERFSEEFSKSRRLKKNLSAALLDIDNFKQINDNYGHLTGDLVLVEFAVFLRKFVRAYDIVGRFGGEEVLIVLPDTDIENGYNLAERIRREIETSLIIEDDKEGEIRITVSIGLASIKDNDTSIDGIIRRTDEALYKAKNNGRNKTEFVV